MALVVSLYTPSLLTAKDSSAYSNGKHICINKVVIHLGSTTRDVSSHCLIGHAAPGRLDYRPAHDYLTCQPASRFHSQHPVLTPCPVHPAHAFHAGSATTPGLQLSLY
jgi:hypothetical protein